MILNHYWFIFKQKNLYKFLYEKLKVVVSLLQKVAQPIVLQNSIGKPIKQNLSLDANLLPASSVSIGFSGLSSLNTLRKLKWTLDATSINNFRKNGKVTITKIIILECSPFRSPWTLYMTALLPYQICPLSNEMQFSRFYKFLETLERIWWTTAKSAVNAAKQCKQFTKDAKVIHLWKAFLWKDWWSLS